MAKKMKLIVTDDVTNRREEIEVDIQISAGGLLVLNGALCMKSSESTAIKEISVNDSNVVSAANAK